MQNAEALKSTKVKLRPQIMRALGIHSNSKKDKITYEQFLNLNSLLKYRRQGKDDMIDFIVRLFDPTMQGFSSNDAFAATLDIMFEADQGDQKSPAKKDATKKKVEIRTPAEELSEGEPSKPGSKKSRAPSIEKEKKDSEGSDEDDDYVPEPEPKERIVVHEKTAEEIMKEVDQEM